MPKGGIKALLVDRKMRLASAALLLILAGLVTWHFFSPRARAFREAEKLCEDAGKPYEEKSVAEQCRLAEQAGIKCSSLNGSQASKDIRAQVNLLHQRCIENVTRGMPGVK